MTRGQFNPDPCSVDGCETRAWGSEMCQKHYNRFRRTGTTTKPTETDRFWSKVDKSDGCWEWTAYRDSRGYGQFTTDDRRMVPSHRFSYELANGPMDSNAQTDHLCRNTSCVRPEHLEAVTPRENTLRGTGPSAVNAAKTHCKRGHEFTPENTYLKGGVHRVCRTCKRESDRARRLRS